MAKKESFHALVQSDAIYNEWLFIDIMRVERSIVNGLHGGDTLKINRKAINASAKADANKQTNCQFKDYVMMLPVSGGWRV